MPIRIQADLPAIEVLEAENIFVMTHERAMTQDIRPLKIAILNLMPTKIETETQLLRLLGNTPLQVDVELLHTATHVSKHTSSYHLNTFYKTFDDVKGQKFDGLIITGAPVEQMPFEEVDYWPEMCAIMEWSRENVYSVLHICWGAQAGLYYHYGIPKYPLPEKLSGIYNHTVLNPYHPLMRGFDDNYFAPHSRYTEVRLEDVKKRPELIPPGGFGPGGAAHCGEPGRPADLCHRTRGVRPGHPGQGVLPGREQGAQPQGPLPLLPRGRPHPDRPPSPGAATPTCWWRTAQLLRVPANPLRLFGLTSGRFFTCFAKGGPPRKGAFL